MSETVRKCPWVRSGIMSTMRTLPLQGSDNTQESGADGSADSVRTHETASPFKAPLTVELRAGDVLVAVSTSADLWQHVLGAVLREEETVVAERDAALSARGTTVRIGSLVASDAGATLQNLYSVTAKRWGAVDQ